MKNPHLPDYHLWFRHSLAARLFNPAEIGLSILVVLSILGILHKQGLAGLGPLLNSALTQYDKSVVELTQDLRSLLEPFALQLSKKVFGEPLTISANGFHFFLIMWIQMNASWIVNLGMAKQAGHNPLERRIKAFLVFSAGTCVALIATMLTDFSLQTDKEILTLVFPISALIIYESVFIFWDVIFVRKHREGPLRALTYYFRRDIYPLVACGGGAFLVGLAAQFFMGPAVWIVVFFLSLLILSIIYTINGHKELSAQDRNEYILTLSISHSLNETSKIDHRDCIQVSSFNIRQRRNISDVGFIMIQYFLLAAIVATIDALFALPLATG